MSKNRNSKLPLVYYIYTIVKGFSSLTSEKINFTRCLCQEFVSRASLSKRLQMLDISKTNKFLTFCL